MVIEAQVFNYKKRTTIGRQILTPETTIELYGETFKSSPIRMYGTALDDKTLQIEISLKNGEGSTQISVLAGEEINGEGKPLKFTPENKLPWLEGRIVYLH